MHLLASINPLYAASGFLVGLLVGLTGVGGGSLMTPLLVLLFGIHPSTAVGTDLLYAAATKTVGTAVHGASGTVDWRVVRRLATGSAPATIITLTILAHAEKQGAGANHLITVVLGVAMIATAIAILFRNFILKHFRERAGEIDPRRTAIFTVILGAILGVLVSLSSVGAGAIGITVLLVLYPDLPVGKLVGSDIAHAVPLTLIAGMGHWMMGSVDFHLLVSLLSGSIPGIVLGSLVSSRVSDRILRPVLASALVLVGSRLVF
ncbi:sulfite exporter TauE/SafE family protein [Phenylobacterium montanum]|uniref:Probable membrane transporter protein n=1 Tax=Phenylobacterium montanum TaxID=2823693 RepID=A0A975G2N2_9CAUL|nr:sulfite exporter TauE/SafE family protein [Caulobacter sp. S6]QUD89423.1 sulfite exporter TauE/SafE family protein [Caulobacter sp. S6]